MKKLILLFMVLLISPGVFAQKTDKKGDEGGVEVNESEGGAGYVQMENNGLRYKQGVPFRLYDGSGSDSYRYEFLTNGMIRNWGASNFNAFSQGVNDSGDLEFIGQGTAYGTSYTRMIIKRSTGNVGIGLISPNNLLDVNGRVRVRHKGETAGVWMSNSANGLSSSDGAFFGMKNDTESGIFIGNNWRFWVNSVGVATISSLAGTGNRLVSADANGRLIVDNTEQRIYLQASDFQPVSGSSTLIRTENRLYFSGIGTLVAAVKLPVGAKITQVFINAKDNLNTGMILYSLESMDVATNSSSQLSYGGSSIYAASPNPIKYASTQNLPITITTNQYYYITITPYDQYGNLISWNSGANFDLFWIEIMYTN